MSFDVPGMIMSLIFFPVFHVGIDSHTMYVIETDGVEMEPYKIDSLTISVAQRYSLLVTAKNATDTNYAMTIMQDPAMYDAVPDDLILNNTLQIVYNAANTPATQLEYDNWADINDTLFVPVQKKAMYQATVEFELGAYFDVRERFLFLWPNTDIIVDV